MSKALLGLTAGSAVALAAVFGSISVNEENAFCKVGGDYPASIVDAKTGATLRTDGIAVDEKAGRCTVDIGNDLAHYVIK